MQTHRKNISGLPMTMNLKIKMLLLISLLVIGILTVFGLFLKSFVSGLVEDQIGKRALSVAESVANIPELKEAFLLQDPAPVIQDLVSPIEKATGAEYIVVGNTEGIRYAHPEPDRIGKHMVGGDNDRALLYGESYISRQEGSLGLSIRGKVPVFDKNGAIIGIVSVGFLNTDVQEVIQSRSKSLWLTLAGIMVLGITGAVLIAHYIKRLLFNMEPEEISYLFSQKEAILQSTHEGIIAVDRNGIITQMNRMARELLSGGTKADFTGKPVRELLPDIDLFDAIEKGETYHNREIVLGGHIVLVNSLPIRQEKNIAGAVATFRSKTDIEHITKELSQVKQYANAQRAQTHEFSNKLYTILGLLQLDQKQEAIAFIKRENNIQLEQAASVVEHAADPLVQGLIQGKFNEANELGITITIDPESRLVYPFSGKEREALLTGMGNLLANAIEAVKHQPAAQKEIMLFFTDIGDDLIIEVQDFGPGIAAADADSIFEQWFSTKSGQGRGTGLALTKHLLEAAGGTIMLEEGEAGGACFVMIIPKDGGEQNG